MQLNLKHEKTAHLGVGDLVEIVRQHLVATGQATAEEAKIAEITPSYDGQYEDRDFDGLKVLIDMTKVGHPSKPPRERVRRLTR